MKMSQEVIISSLLTKIISYSSKYEISIQFWPEQCAIFIAKDGVDLTSFGSSDIEVTLNNGLDYLDRITRKKA